VNEQNRLRLERIATRYGARTAQAESEPRAEAQDGDEDDAAFLAAFERVRNDVLRPVMAEVGMQLKRAGYLFRIIHGGDRLSPSIDLQVLLANRGDSKDTIRFFARKDVERGWQVIGEVELKRSPIELTRFEDIAQIAHDVVEHLVIDAVEQMFASTVGPMQSKPPPGAPTSTIVLSPTPPRCESAPLPSEPAIVIERLRALPVDTTGMPPESPELVVAREPCDPVPAALARAVEPAPTLLTDAPEARWARWAGAQGVGETEEVDVSVFRRASLPFKKGPPAPAFFAAADAAHAEPREPHGSATGHETVLLREGQPLAPVTTTPPRAGRAGKTLVLDVQQAPSMPFHAPSEPAPSPSAPLPATRLGTATAAPVASATVPALDIARRATPPEMSVEQYAWLVATLRRTAPSDLLATLARLRLSPESLQDLEERWSRRMAADPALKDAFLAALTRHLGPG